MKRKARFKSSVIIIIGKLGLTHKNGLKTQGKRGNSKKSLFERRRKKFSYLKIVVGFSVKFIHIPFDRALAGIFSASEGLSDFIMIGRKEN